MGIQDFASIRNSFLQSSSLQQLVRRTQNVPANIYIDGSFFLFSGLINSNVRSDGSYDEERVAETAFLTIQRQIELIKSSYSNIKQIRFFFDGMGPTLKSYTSLKRKLTMNLTHPLNIDVIMNFLAKNLNTCPQIFIQNLIIGEAEHEAFTRRDVTCPSIIVTDDSDIIHISYAYQPQTPNDVVFICKKGLSYVYDAGSLQEAFGNIPKVVFTTLMMLHGSDLTNSVFTKTMLFSVLNIWQQPPNERSRMQCRIIQCLEQIGEQQKPFEIAIQTNNIQIPSVTANSHTFYRQLKENVLLEEADEKTLPVLEHVYTVNVIFKIIRLLLGMILLQNKTRIYWNRTSKFDGSIMKTYSELCSITWAVNYSLIGAYVRGYQLSNNEYVVELAPLSFHDDILTKSLSSLNAERNNANTSHITHKRFIKNKTSYLRSLETLITK